MQELSLDGEWDLYYTIGSEVEPESPAEMMALGYQRVPAALPSTIEIDLMKAGVLPELFEGSNIEAAWPLEFGDYWYIREFGLPQELADADSLALRFEGIDTIADVFLNGELVASTDNMLVPHEIPIARPRPGTNVVAVHIRSVVRHAEKFEYTPLGRDVYFHAECRWIRKAPHMFGWNIAPRIVSGGLWRSVSVVARQRPYISDFYICTRSVDVAHRTATVRVHYVLSDAPRGEDCRIEIEAVEPVSGHRFAVKQKVYFLSGSFDIQVAGAELWWPKNAGRPALYDLSVQLYRENRLADEHHERIGIRHIEIQKIDLPIPDGDFRLVVNGTSPHILGTNWVPVDALHSRDHERLPQALALLGEVGCNAVRCWGGNVYEHDDFFDWCDENGVLVWQDFAFANAVYPWDATFLERVRNEATAVVKRLRNHASLAVWAGNNEIDYSFIRSGLNPEDDVITRQVLRRAVLENDPVRPYLPSAPYYGPAVSPHGVDAGPDQHIWPFPPYFKDDVYARNGAKFIGEIGFYGSPAAHSVRQFIGPDAGVPNPADRVWRLHDTSDLRQPAEPERTAIDIMSGQIAHLFGSAPDDLDTYTKASQIAQAEAFKYIVERSRLGKPDQTGILWWNLLDSWPSISGSVVDYYFLKKLAFPYIRRVQAPVCAMLSEPADWKQQVVLANDTLDSHRVSYTVRELGTDDLLHTGTVTVGAGENTVVGTLPAIASRNRCVVLEWDWGQGPWGNHYVTGSPPLDLTTYLDDWLPQIAKLGPGFSVHEIWP